MKSYFNRHELSLNKSIIMAHFRGITHTTIECSSCSVVSNSYDAFLALSLPIPQIFEDEIDIYYMAANAV